MFNADIEISDGVVDPTLALQSTFKRPPRLKKKVTVP